MRRCEMAWQNTRTTMTHLICLYIFICFTFTRFITCLRQRELGNYNAMHPVFYVILLKSLKVVHRRGFPQANFSGYVTGVALNAVDNQRGYIVITGFGRGVSEVVKSSGMLLNATGVTAVYISGAFTNRLR